MTAFKGHKTTLVADVDCTAQGEPLCEKVGVQGYPTIKYGDPNGLEDYEGGRDYEELKSFAESLKPVCTPSQLDSCSEEDKALIKEYEALSVADLKEKVETKETAIKDAESTFEKEVEKLQEKYEELEKTKSETIADIKKSGLGLLKSVIAAKGKGEL
jgi:predicted nuclease with TOPRIM domain